MTMAAKTSHVDAERVSRAIVSMLIRSKVDAPLAAKCALVCKHVYSYLQNNPQTFATTLLSNGKDLSEIKRSVTNVYQATRIILHGNNLHGGVPASEALRDFRASNVAPSAGLTLFVLDIAHHFGLPLNEFSLTLSKVDLDLLGAGRGIRRVYSTSSHGYGNFSWSWL